MPLQENAMERTSGKFWPGMDPRIWKDVNPSQEKQSKVIVREFANFPSSHMSPSYLRVSWLNFSSLLVVLFIICSFSFCLSPPTLFLWSFPGRSEGKESACNVGDPGLIPGWEDLLEKEMATHSSVLARKIPRMKESGYSPWGHKELDMTERLTHTPYFYRMFQSLDFILQIFSCYLFILHIVPSLHYLQCIFLFLFHFILSFVNCLAPETWRLCPLCLLWFCPFFILLALSGTPSSAPSTVLLGHSSLFLYWNLFLEMNLINSGPQRCK